MKLMMTKISTATSDHDIHNVVGKAMGHLITSASLNSADGIFGSLATLLGTREQNEDVQNALDVLNEMCDVDISICNQSSEEEMEHDSSHQSV